MKQTVESLPEPPKEVPPPEEPEKEPVAQESSASEAEETGTADSEAPEGTVPQGETLPAEAAKTDVPPSVPQEALPSKPKVSKEDQLGRRFEGREKPEENDRYTVTLQDIENEVRIRRSRERPQMISLNFKETRLDAVIRLLGEVSGFNFVIHPSVGELKTTNMLLTDVTWEQALDIVLKTHNLAMQKTESVILITTYDNLLEQQRLSSQEAEERKRQAEAQRLELEEQLKSQRIAEEEKLTFKTFRLKHAQAREVMVHIGQLYGVQVAAAAARAPGTAGAAGAARTTGAGGTTAAGGASAGTVAAAGPTAAGAAGGIRLSIFEPDNTITVFGTESQLAEIAKRIEELDKPVPQIYIQARIVEIGKNYSKGLGIQWGGFYAGNTGADFPNTVGVAGASGTGQPGASVGESAINFPAFNVTVDESGNVRPPEESAGIGFNLAHVAGTVALNARLTALEKDGKSKTISNPKIITLNGREAVISSGRKVPIQTIDDEGKIQTEFVDATLELKVTPVITDKETMFLTIAAKRDEVDFTRVVQGNPTIVKKEVNTTIRVSNGGTAVLGGIFEERSSTTDSGVPSLRKVPVLGKAFGSNKNTDEGSELLIFITPSILESQTVS